MYTLKTVHGWAFPEADEFMANEMKPDGRYQASHLEAALGFVTDFSCAVDVGAHVGTWCRLMSPKFARVIAVEPSPDTFGALTVNMRRFECANVELLNMALGAKPGFVSMVLDGRGLELANTGARYVKAGGDIPCDTVDSWRLPSLGFLKIDAEGSEPLILEGAALTLQRCKPIVLYEQKGFCTRYGQPKDAPAKLLTSLGYRECAVAGCDRIWSAK